MKNIPYLTLTIYVHVEVVCERKICCQIFFPHLMNVAVTARPKVKDNYIAKHRNQCHEKGPKIDVWDDQKSKDW